MRLAFVLSNRSFGGVKAWSLDAAAKLTEFGHEVIAFGRPGPFIDKARENGLEAHAMRFGPDFGPLKVAEFIGFFRRRRIDLVMANVGKDLRTAGVAARLLGIPVVHRVGLIGDMKDSPKVKWTHRFIGPTMLVPCETLKTGLLQRHSFLRAEEIKAIHTGKLPAEAPPTAVHSPRRLIVSSQLAPAKAHAELLEALARLKAEGVEYVCDIVGTGSSEEELKRRANALDIADRLTWHGFSTNVRGLLAQADIFVLPSYSEGFPNSLLEALAEGLVPVARNVGGVAEAWPPDHLNQDDMPDLLYNEREGPQRLAELLKAAVQLPAPRLLELKRSAYFHMKDHLHLAAQARKLESFFLSLAAAERTKG